MTIQELKVAISEFRRLVAGYRDLLVRSRDRVIPRVVRNQAELQELRARLNEEYGRLQKYIKALGNRPVLKEPATGSGYETYGTAFCGDPLLIRVGPSLEAVLQDLDFIGGKLNGLSEQELRDIMVPPRREPIQQPKRKDYWKWTNPIWLVWELGRLIWRHRIISGVLAVLGFLAIDYSLAWKNLNWIWTQITSPFTNGR